MSLGQAAKIAVSGKGGVGKTTVAAGLCLALAGRGYEILALDCDPDSNLAGTLGFPELDSIRPLSALTELIEERTGAKPGAASGAIFKLNPHVADIPDTYCHRHDRIKLVVMDGIKQGGQGCACPQNTLMRRLVREVVVARSEAVVMDMEAGLEHLGRSTAGAVSSMVVVIEPGRRSVSTAQSILALAQDLGISHRFVLGNRFTSEDDFAEFVATDFPAERVLGWIPFDRGIAAADRAGTGIEGAMAPTTRERIERVLDRLEELASAI
jgi:CO dehydrogenase maturation factor